MRLYYRLFKSDEEKIAYDMLTAYSNSNWYEQFSGFYFDEERVVGVRWLSEAVKSTLDIVGYKTLSFSAQHSLDSRFYGLLMPHKNGDSFPVYAELYYRDHMDQAGYFIDYYRIRTRLEISTAEAVRVLKISLVHIIMAYFPSLYVPNKKALTLMCINKYHKNTLFGQLPHGIAKIIAKQVKEDDRLAIIEGPHNAPQETTHSG